jgi:hypothetical protein
MTDDATFVASGGELPVLGNPFHLLAVSSRDGRHRIVEAAEEKSLSLDSDACSKARTDLTTPRNRLAAETAWLPGISPRRAQQLIETLIQNPYTIFDAEGLPPLAHTNLMASAVLALDPALDEESWCSHVMALNDAFDMIDAETVLADINEDRKVAGFVEVKSVEAIEEALAERRREYSNCLRNAVNRLSPLMLARVVSHITEVTTASGTAHPPPLIDELVDYYAVGTHSFLTREADNIRLLIDRVQQASPSGDTAVSPLLGRLDKVVRNWYAIAKPIQMVAGAKGTTHELSQEVAAQIRSLGIYLYNEHSLLGVSQRIVGLLQDAFGSIPEIAERAADDARALDEVARKTETEAQVKPVYELCTKALEAIKGNPGGGAKEAANVLATGKPLIKRLLKDGLTQATVIELEDVIALTVLRCATTHGNASNNWVHAISLLEQAVVLAHDEEILNRIETNLATARQNHRLFNGLESIVSAPSLRTLNGFGFAVYGNTDYDKTSGSYMATYYFVALFFPIFPICRYRVIPTANGFNFLGKGPLRAVDKWHLAISVIGLLLLLSSIH